MTEAQPRRTDTLILGAGPAGLAVGACLRARGVPFEIIERRARLGGGWPWHYRRLHLHTMARHSSLPFVPFPPDAPTYPSRQQVVDYLDDYARRFGLAPHLGVTAQEVRQEADGRWRVRTDAGAWSAARVVVATGYTRVPVTPALPGLEGFPGATLHSAAYQDGAAFRGQRVLVIGCGNSGAEIALDLFEHGARPTMVIRGPVHVFPRDVMGMPAQRTSLLLAPLPTWLRDGIGLAAANAVFGDLSAWGIRRPALGPTAMIMDSGRIPLVDVGTIDLVKQGAIAVAPGVEGFEGAEARFADGSRRAFDAVVLATGYRAALGDFMANAGDLTDERGYPRWHGEEVPHRAGLFFVGFRNPPTGALREIGLEARRVARAIARCRGGR